jgi:hypothetical protein
MALLQRYYTAFRQRVPRRSQDTGRVGHVVQRVDHNDQVERTLVGYSPGVDLPKPDPRIRSKAFRRQSQRDRIDVIGSTGVRDRSACLGPLVRRARFHPDHDGPVCRPQLDPNLLALGSWVWCIRQPSIRIWTDHCAKP